ncbi:hypothetical protein Ae201684P_001689 [Aphanomyces euteiches]|uniref:DUF1232 domain-containing protein n=1 Tax=Aphanomyces euteiches TaxID=100861 RepID=A0A6G0X9F6_9STRA|nr:hypothetical protein Ae201684_007171 [Aphanomyces euteiches]KAH9052509.1 hypothetical protein Ae201684P_001689 [Aphanomyces euteiches]KAH9155490.1 hypothetical protein AeRB84_002534 [Aphanomyces euteiches]
MVIEGESTGKTEAWIAFTVFITSTICMGLLVYSLAKPSTAAPALSVATCAICLTDLTCGPAIRAGIHVHIVGKRYALTEDSLSVVQIELLHAFLSRDENDSREGQKVLRQIAKFNVTRARTHGGASTIRTWLQVPVLLRWATHPQALTVLWSPLRVLCGIIVWVYIMSPLDLFPEAVFGILGYLDDLVLVVVVLFALAHSVRRDLIHQAQSLLR